MAFPLQPDPARRFPRRAVVSHEVAMTRVMRRPTTTTRRAAHLIQAPGKKHRPPPPSIRGVRHSDEMIAKQKQVDEKRRWARD